jgi:hypothetical protein
LFYRRIKDAMSYALGYKNTEEQKYIIFSKDAYKTLGEKLYIHDILRKTKKYDNYTLSLFYKLSLIDFFIFDIT